MKNYPNQFGWPSPILLKSWFSDQARTLKQKIQILVGGINILCGKTIFATKILEVNNFGGQQFLGDNIFYKFWGPKMQT